MTGYIRQSIAEIAIDEEIKAEPLNDEFNALADAFNSTNGHAHDGTSGSGPKINLTTSITGNLPAGNIANQSIPLQKLETIADNKIVGNVTGSTNYPTTVDILDEDNMVSNRDDALPTQQSVKAYVDTLDAAIVVALDDVVDYIDGELEDLQTEIESNITNKICFSARKAVSQSVTTFDTKITFTNKVIDIGSHYDTSTSRWTPPAGRYRLTFSVVFSGSASAQVSFTIKKNGSIFGSSYSSYTGGTGLDTIFWSNIIETSGTDYYEVFYSTSGGFTFNIYGDSDRDSTFFCGEQI